MFMNIIVHCSTRVNQHVHICWLYCNRSATGWVMDTHCASIDVVVCAQHRAFFYRIYGHVVVIWQYTVYIDSYTTHCALAYSFMYVVALFNRIHMSPKMPKYIAVLNMCIDAAIWHREQLHGHIECVVAYELGTFFVNIHHRLVFYPSSAGAA